MPPGHLRRLLRFPFLANLLGTYLSVDFNDDTLLFLRVILRIAGEGSRLQICQMHPVLVYYSVSVYGGMPPVILLTFRQRDSA